MRSGRLMLAMSYQRIQSKFVCISHADMSQFASIWSSPAVAMHAIKASAETKRAQHGNTTWLKNPLMMLLGSMREHLRGAMRRGAPQDVETAVGRACAKAEGVMHARQFDNVPELDNIV